MNCSKSRSLESGSSLQEGPSLHLFKNGEFIPEDSCFSSIGESDAIATRCTSRILNYFRNLAFHVNLVRFANDRFSAQDHLRPNWNHQLICNSSFLIHAKIPPFEWVLPCRVLWADRLKTHLISESRRYRIPPLLELARVHSKRWSRWRNCPAGSVSNRGLYSEFGS